MKETIKNSRIAGQLEKMYRALNADKFNNELEEVFITIQSTPRTYGHVTCSKVWHSKSGLSRYELNIGAGTLDRPIENVVSTLLHEMVHIYNMQHDIQDCSRGNTYHNKKFKAKAESVGLVIEYDKRIGYSITSPSDDLILYIADKGWEDIQMNRLEYSFVSSGRSGGSGDGSTGTAKTKKPSSTRKYICPCCGNSVRATKDLNIICGDCMKNMIKDE